MVLTARFALVFAVFAAFAFASLMLAGCAQAPPQGGGAQAGATATPSSAYSVAGGVPTVAQGEGGTDESGDFFLPDGSDAQGGADASGAGAEMDSFG